MSDGYKAEKVKAITLIWVAILSIVLTVIWDVWTLFLPTIAFCTQNVSNLIPTLGVELMGSPFLMLLVVMALIRAPSIRKHLTTTTLVYLYATTLAVAYFANTSHPWGYAAGFLFVNALSETLPVNYVPEFMAPSKNVAELLWLGVGSIGAIPWATLIPEIIWHFLLVALFGCISIGIVSIFRRQWIDVEMVPFPHVMAAYTCLINVESSVKKEWPSKTPFLLGMLVGFLLAIPVSGATLFPWFPDIFMWRTNTCGPGTHWIAPPDIPWHLGIPKHPPVYALMLIVPLHALISLAFYTLVTEAIFFVSFYMGYYTGFTQMEFCGRNWCEPIPYVHPPLSLASIMTGGTLGLFVSVIFLQRGYIIETLKLAFGKTSKRGEEPISYRTAWLIFILSLIAMVVYFTASGFSPWVSFVMPITGIITWFTMARLWGRLGFTTEPCYSCAPGIARLLAFPTLQYPDITSLDVGVAPYIIEEQLGHQSICGWGGSFYATLASYKMAKLTGVDPRSVLKVLAVAIFVSMLVTKVVQETLLGVVGASRFTFPTVKAPPDDRWFNMWSRPTELPIVEATPWIATGFVFMVVMRYLYSRILWLPDPSVAILAWCETSGLTGLWFACIVAWIVKSAVLKIGGSKLYEERVVPFVGGFIMGDALETFIAALMSYAIFPPAL